MFLIEMIVYSFNLGVCDGLEGTDFSQFLLWEEVLVLKELIFTVSTLGWCGGLDRTDI